MVINHDTLRLLRFPFSFLLMPVFLLAFSQALHPDLGKSLLSFLIFHLLVYPASNGYNSYVDRDETSIGGLEHPPLPTRELFYVSILFDLVACLIAFFLVGSLFAFCILMYIVASRAYSSRQIRLKKYPLLGFLTVVFFQGAFTYFTVTIAISSNQLSFNAQTLFILLACSFQIAGAYPLTQIYQHQQDLKDGVVTLSYKLGYKGTFLFTALMFLLCNVFYFFYFEMAGRSFNFFILQMFFLPLIVYFFWWFLKVLKNQSNASFKNTMRMNWIAAACMNTCFIIIYFLNHPSF